jgi:hypothetical protein
VLLLPAKLHPHYQRMLFEKLKSEDDLESLLTDMKIEADQRANE